jgi:hypothetical protein
MRLITAALAASVLLAAPLSAQAAKPDPNYAPALAAVDGFLFSWSKADATGGMAYASPDLAHTIGDAKIKAYLSGPGHAAFEVGKGQKGAGGTITFPIRLVWAQGGATSRIDTATIRAQQTGSKWYVVSLPYGAKTGQ